MFMTKNIHITTLWNLSYHDKNAVGIPDVSTVDFHLGDGCPRHHWNPARHEKSSRQFDEQLHSDWHDFVNNHPYISCIPNNEGRPWNKKEQKVLSHVSGHKRGLINDRYKMELWGPYKQPYTWVNGFLCPLRMGYSRTIVQFQTSHEKKKRPYFFPSNPDCLLRILIIASS